MRPSRLFVWLLRHPMAAVVVLLVAIAVFATAGAQLLTRPSSPKVSSTREVEVAPYTLPTPTQYPPQRRVDAAHKALHELGRACETSTGGRRSQRIRAQVDVIEGFATDFPSGGFLMDDESASSLALLVVVWDELKSCDPDYVPQIERLIPVEYRGS